MSKLAPFALIFLVTQTTTPAGEVHVAPAEIVTVTNERLRLSPVPPRSYSQGTKLKQLQHFGPGQGVPANGAIDADSVVVRHNSRVLVPGKDYLLDRVWGSLGIGPEPSISEEDQVTVDYRFSLRRVDSLVDTPETKQVVRQGKSHLFSQGRATGANSIRRPQPSRP